MSAFAIACAVILVIGGGPTLAATNVILFIGDGMGPEQIKAGRFFKGADLCFETWPHRAMVTTRSAGGRVTDSAAAATAMATGHKVRNGVLSMAYPGAGAGKIPEIKDNTDIFGVLHDALVGAVAAEVPAWRGCTWEGQVGQAHG